MVNPEAGSFGHGSTHVDGLRWEFLLWQPALLHEAITSLRDLQTHDHGGV